MPVISVLGRLRQEDWEFQASLGYIVSPKEASATQWDPTSKKKKKFLLVAVGINMCLVTMNSGL
jgi:hypothetical protein